MLKKNSQSLIKATTQAKAYRQVPIQTHKSMYIKTSVSKDARLNKASSPTFIEPQVVLENKKMS